ncbi:MAG: hypothetical protein GX760_04130 [Erysipelothrix sp.]|nr:hypothetical protein [Erysipelothrix sp.]
MEHLFKILNKENKEYLINDKSRLKDVEHYNKQWQKQGLTIKVDSDFRYFDFMLQKTSFDNMQTIMNTYFEIKEELREIWDIVEYKERHFLLYQQLNPIIEKLTPFYRGEKRLFITYFDELINAYYDHDMLMFDNDNFRKYLYHYESLVVSNQYGILPYESGYVDVDVIVGDDHNFVIYMHETKRFYWRQVRDDQPIDLSFGLAFQINMRQIQDIITIIRSHKKDELIHYLIEEQLIYPSIKKQIVKLLEKGRD